MSSARMAGAGERFLRTKKAQKALEGWADRLIGRRIVKLAWDYRMDDTLAIQITLDDGQQLLGPSAAEDSSTTWAGSWWSDMPKKTEPVYRRTCYCGSAAFRATITIEIADVPVWFSKKGTLTYDDIKGHSRGWDTDAQPKVACAKCGHLFDIERTGDPLDTADLKGKEVGDAA